MNTILYPLTAAAIAKPIPVLPDVGSIKTSPGISVLDYSASSTIRLPILSLTEPAGFKNSHLTRSSHSIPSSLVMLLILTMGVLPMQSRIESLIFFEWSRVSFMCGHF